MRKNEPLFLTEEKARSYKGLQRNFVSDGGKDLTIKLPMDAREGMNKGKLQPVQALQLATLNGMLIDADMETAEQIPEQSSAGMWIEKPENDYKLVSGDINDQINVFTINFFEDSDMTDFNMMADRKSVV